MENQLDIFGDVTKVLYIRELDALQQLVSLIDEAASMINEDPVLLRKTVDLDGLLHWKAKAVAKLESIDSHILQSKSTL